MMMLFLRFELHKLANYFKTKTTAKIITSLLFLAVLVFVAIGVYVFFVSGFKYINIEAVDGLQSALSLFLYELFLLVLSGVIIFSAFVTGMFNLFRSGYNNWILSTPGYKVFPKFVSVKSLISSLLLSLVIFIPAILALHKVYTLGVVSLFFILVSVVLFLMMVNALTLSAIILIGYSYYKLSHIVKRLRFSFKGLMIIILALIASNIVVLWRMVATIDLVKLFKAEEITDVLAIATISTHFTYLPTHSFAMEILSWQNGTTQSALAYFGILAILTFLSVVIWWKISPLFYPLWQKFQEGSGAGGMQKDTSTMSLQRHSMVYHFTGSATMALFKKEALVSSRNMKGVLWFLFLLSIWLAEIGVNTVLGTNVRRYATDISERYALLQAFQFIIAVYFMCAFTLRFVFPSFSAEKKTSWILTSAPINFKKVFFGKYIFYTTFFVVLGTVMSYLSSLTLHATRINVISSMTLFVATVIFIVTFGLTLGALFPNTETDDPEVISTSLPGLFFTVLSLIYGSLSAYILYLALTKGMMTLLIGFVILTFVVIGSMLLTTPKILKNKIY